MRENTTSDRKIVRTAPVEVSPISSLPPGLDEGNYRIFGVDDENSGSVELLDSGEIIDERTAGTGLATPTNISIKSQTFRTAPDGTTVVDVVVSVGEVADATNYELRVAATNA